MKHHRVWFLVGGLVACGGAEFTAPDDAGRGGGTTSSSSAMTTGMTSVASSTTTTGAGGTAGSAGRGGTGGQMADAQPDAPVSCDAATPSPVKFHMKTPDGVDFCINNCSGIWVSILPAGSNTPLSVSRSCITTCDVCQPIACDIACVPPQHVKPGGETYTWDGTLWQSSKCGPQMYACVNEVCSVPAGPYTARMCAYRGTGDGGSFCMFDPAPVCVDVPFVYPTADTVEGVIH